MKLHNAEVMQLYGICCLVMSFWRENARAFIADRITHLGVTVPFI